MPSFTLDLMAQYVSLVGAARRMIFVATKVLSRQTCVCCVFDVINMCLCGKKNTCFVITKVCL